ncbi:MAG: DUF3530 family protein [Paraglaciecola sp.]|nr:DUF3530 family protein [Paraglaciecola sp.]NCT46806.1 DUF3530 family protein [Paraglaciecola sp.]
MKSQLLVGILLIWQLLFAQNAWAAIDKNELLALDMRRALFSDEYVVLNVNEQQLVMQLRENTNAIARGVSLLISDSGELLGSDDASNPLIAQLNSLGWVTMVITVPTTEMFALTNLPTDNADSLSAKLMTSQLDPERYQANLTYMAALMQGAMEQVRRYPGFVLVITQGMTAATLSQLYAEGTLNAPDAMVVINPYLPDRQYNKKLANYLAKTPMPVLDLYNQSDSRWSQSQVVARRTAAIKTLKLEYRQREIIGVAWQAQSTHYIGKEIQGWLKHMGW